MTTAPVCGMLSGMSLGVALLTLGACDSGTSDTGKGEATFTWQDPTGTWETSTTDSPQTGTTDEPTTTTETTPTDTPGETGLVMLWYGGHAQVDMDAELPEFLHGSFGTFLTTAGAQEVVCDNTGTWSEAGQAPGGCPDCAWSFELCVDDTVAEGPACDVYGRVEGAWDGFCGGWGFAETYSFWYGDYEYTLDTVVMYYYAYYGGWGPLAYNYAGWGYNTGDASDVEFWTYYKSYYYYVP